MPNEDLKNVWQTQPTENSTITMLTIEKKMHELHARTRRHLQGTLVAPLVAAAVYMFALSQFTLPEGLHLLFAAAVAWSLAGLWVQLRGLGSTAMPATSGLETGLAFCRRELERRRLLLSRVLLWGLSPMLLAFAAFIGGLARVARGSGGLIPKAIPFLTLLLLWIVAYFIQRWREQRGLTRDLEELNLIGRSST